MRLITVISLLSGGCLFGGGLVDQTSTGFVPLTAPGAGVALGTEGGLYPGGANRILPDHLALGLARAALVVPRDATGQPHPDGRIGILTTGMSNASMTFGRLGELMNGAWNSKVVFVNGAQGSMDASLWADAGHECWQVAQDRIAAAGLTAAQIQVVLNYHAVAHSRVPVQPWPATPQDLQGFQESIARHLTSKFPNAVLGFWATREYGGYSTSVNNPEPFAHRSGFAVKWMIGRQIAGAADLNANPAAGPVVAPWLDWGPYTWADGLVPRDDGLLWEPRDFQSDGTHPTRRGVLKLAGAWATLLQTSPLTRPWALPPGNLPPLCDVISPEDRALLTLAGPVALEAHAQDDDGHVTRVEFFVNDTKIGEDTEAPYCLLWTPPATGDYPVRVVAWDDDGASRTSSTVTARIRPPVAASQTIATDGFESGDFLGGSGWAGQSWLTSNATSTQGGAADGQWSAQLSGAASVARSLQLASTTGVKLDFSWNATLPTGAALIVEIRDTDWRTVFTRNASNVAPGWQTATIELGGYQPSASFGVRFRSSGTGALVRIDAVRVWTAATAAAPELGLEIEPAGPAGLLLTWPTATLRTYTIEATGDFGEWRPLLHTTTTETSTSAQLVPLDGERRFFRAREWTPDPP